MVNVTILCRTRSNGKLRTMMSSVSKFVSLWDPSLNQELHFDEKNETAIFKMGTVFFQYDDRKEDIYLLEFVLSRFLIRLNNRTSYACADLFSEQVS